MSIACSTLKDLSETLTTTHHKMVKVDDPVSSTFIWTCTSSHPFNELILTWNGKRPASHGHYTFFLKFLIDGNWTSWIEHATWGYKVQKGASSYDDKGLVLAHQDTVEIKAPHLAKEFSVKIEAYGTAKLADLHSVSTCVTLHRELPDHPTPLQLPNVHIDVPTLSQFTLPHPRCHHMCSATSTSAVIAYLSNTHPTPGDTVSVALNSHDHTFDILGNWILMTAHASSLLGTKWKCWVQRLKGFDELHQQLLKGHPVVVSIKGPINGGALPYEQGHIIVVKGFDAENQRVICMDPAFQSPQQNHTSYALSDFMAAWKKRKYVAYLFNPTELIHPAD